MWEDIIGIPAHSMRNNVIFYRVPKEKDEDPIEVVKKFIKLIFKSILLTSKLNKPIVWKKTVSKARESQGARAHGDPKRPLIENLKLTTY